MADIVQLEEKGTLLYPKTHAKSVDGLEDAVKNIVKETELSKGVKVWEGGLIFTQTHVITPSIPLSQCNNGWRIKWVRYNPVTGNRDESYCFYSSIPKTHKGTMIVDVPHAGENVYSRKMFNVTDTTISGNNANDPGTSNGTSATFRMIVTEVETE